MPQGPRLNLTQLSTLRELVRRGTLAAAAEHLGYTPGAASQHLASLEASLGVALVTVGSPPRSVTRMRAG